MSTTATAAKTTYTREELISICERAIVSVDRWMNRDTPSSQGKVGLAWAYLKAGCQFRVLGDEEERLRTDDKTIWLWICHPTFSTFESDEPEADGTYYLPTPARLDASAGGDWY